MAVLEEGALLRRVIACLFPEIASQRIFCIYHQTTRPGQPVCSVVNRKGRILPPGFFAEARTSLLCYRLGISFSYQGMSGGLCNLLGSGALLQQSGVFDTISGPGLCLESSFWNWFASAFADTVDSLLDTLQRIFDFS